MFRLLTKIFFSFVVLVRPEITSSQNAFEFYPHEISFPDLNKVDVSDHVLNNFSDGRCRTPNGEEGECRLVEECPELIELIKIRKGIHTPGTADIFNGRICEYLVRDIKFCCLTNSSSSPAELALRKPRPAILPTEKECGDPLINVRVSRGKDFEHGSHPWLVGVGYPREGEAFKVECGGTLITRSHVLTAAHCFAREQGVRSPELTHVILGEHSLSKEGEETIVLRILENKNPGYNATIYYHDIALILLEREITFTDYIRPACLPFDSQLQHFDLQKDKMTIVGWGRTYFGDNHGTDEPREAELSVVPKPECRKAYESTPEILLDETQICLGQNGKDACRGDSGGPLLFTHSQRFHVLIGVIAFGGIECGSSTYPGVYTYVPKYMDWIIDNV